MSRTTFVVRSLAGKEGSCERVMRKLSTPGEGAQVSRGRIGTSCAPFSGKGLRTVPGALRTSTASRSRMVSSPSVARIVTGYRALGKPGEVCTVSRALVPALTMVLSMENCSPAAPETLRRVSFKKPLLGRKTNTPEFPAHNWMELESATSDFRQRDSQRPSMDRTPLFSGSNQARS